MTKPSTHVLLMQARQQIADLQYNLEYLKGFTVRQCAEVAMITLHQKFGFGPDRCVKFHEEFMENFVELAQMVVDDGKDDENLEWSIERFDRLVKEACGEQEPFKERYASKNLYLRERDLKG